MAQKVTPKKQVVEDPRHTQAVQNYESGLRALQEHKFDKAKGHLQKVLSGPNKSLVDRAQVHLLTCDKHMEKPGLQFKTSEEHYDFAVSLINTGDYVTAREHLDKLLKQISVRLCSVRTGRAHLPDRARRRIAQDARRGDPGQPRSAFPGAKRFRLPEPGRRSALHRVAVSGSGSRRF